jgi:hypothetical protein
MHSYQSNVVKDKQGNILTDPAKSRPDARHTFSDLYNQVNINDDTVLLEIPQDLRANIQLDSNNTDQGQSTDGPFPV